MPLSYSQAILNHHPARALFVRGFREDVYQEKNMFEEKIGVFLPSMGIEDAGKAFATAHRLGFRCCQPWCIDREIAHEMKAGQSADAVRDARDKYGFTISALSGYMDFTADDAKRKVKEFRRQIDLAVEFGAGAVCTETGRNFSSRDDKTAWSRLTEALKEICRYAEDKGVAVAIEMGPRDLVATVAGYNRLRELVDSPRLKVNYDPANIVRGGGDPLAVLRELKSEVAHAHIKDALPERQMPLGQGKVDFATMFRLLEESGYEGYFAIEKEYASDKAQVECVAEGYQYIREILRRREEKPCLAK